MIPEAADYAKDNGAYVSPARRSSLFFTRKVAMKRHLAASICVLITCASPVLAQAPDWRDYFPLKVGQRWTYIVNADPKKEVVIEVERTEDFTRMAMKDDKKNSEKFTGFILKSSSGDKVTRDHVVVMENGVYRIYAAGTLINPPLLFFKFGLQKVGETWDVDSTSGNITIKGTYSIRRGEVQVPYAKKPLNAIIVSFSNNKPGDERHEIEYWFAKDLGMVKQRVSLKNHHIVLELKSTSAK